METQWEPGRTRRGQRGTWGGPAGHGRLSVGYRSVIGRLSVGYRSVTGDLKMGTDFDICEQKVIFWGHDFVVDEAIMLVKQGTF